MKALPLRNRVNRVALPATLAAVLAGCSPDPGTGPMEVKWDRDACERCVMVLSDRHFAAQVRGGPERSRRVFKFDDIGCAVLWLEAQAWQADPTTEIWVKDHRDARWIDARSAYYVPGRTTPMEYGLGAQSDPVPDGLDFEAAREHIHMVEQRFSNDRGLVIPPIPPEYRNPKTPAEAPPPVPHRDHAHPQPGPASP